MSVSDNTKKDNQKPAHTGHRQRMKQKLMSDDTNNLSDRELLEIILFMSNPRADTREQASKILDHFRSINNLLKAPLDSLENSGVLTPAQIATIRCIQISAQRVLIQEVEKSDILKSWVQINQYLQIRIGNEKTEHLLIYCLNKSFKVIHEKAYSQHDISSVYVHPRTITELALKHKASYILLSHNHPSGQAKPSISDINFTNEVNKQLKLFEITLHDHVVVTSHKMFSFKNNNLIK